MDFNHTGFGHTGQAHPILFAPKLFGSGQGQGFVFLPDDKGLGRHFKGTSKVQGHGNGFVDILGLSPRERTGAASAIGERIRSIVGTCLVFDVNPGCRGLRPIAFQRHAFPQGRHQCLIEVISRTILTGIQR